VVVQGCRKDARGVGDLAHGSWRGNPFWRNSSRRAHHVARRPDPVVPPRDYSSVPNPLGHLLSSVSPNSSSVYRCAPGALCRCHIGPPSRRPRRRRTQPELRVDPLRPCRRDPSPVRRRTPPRRARVAHSGPFGPKSLDPRTPTSSCPFRSPSPANVPDQPRRGHAAQACRPTRSPPRGAWVLTISAPGNRQQRVHARGGWGSSAPIGARPPADHCRLRRCRGTARSRPGRAARRSSTAGGSGHSVRSSAIDCRSSCQHSPRPVGGHVVHPPMNWGARLGAVAAGLD